MLTRDVFGCLYLAFHQFYLQGFCVAVIVTSCDYQVNNNTLIDTFWCVEFIWVNELCHLSVRTSIECNWFQPHIDAGDWFSGVGHVILTALFVRITGRNCLAKIKNSNILQYSRSFFRRPLMNTCVRPHQMDGLLQSAFVTVIDCRPKLTSDPYQWAAPTIAGYFPVPSLQKSHKWCICSHWRVCFCLKFRFIFSHKYLYGVRNLMIFKLATKRASWGTNSMIKSARSCSVM